MVSLTTCTPKTNPSMKLGKHTNPIEYLGNDHQPLSPQMPVALYPTSTTALVLGHGTQDVAPTCCGTGRTIGNKLLMNPMGKGKRIIIRVFEEIRNKIKFWVSLLHTGLLWGDMIPPNQSMRPQKNLFHCGRNEWLFLHACKDRDWEKVHIMNGFSIYVQKYQPPSEKVQINLHFFKASFASKGLDPGIYFPIFLQENKDIWPINISPTYSLTGVSLPQLSWGRWHYNLTIKYETVELAKFSIWTPFPPPQKKKNATNMRLTFEDLTPF